jgi:hypothetical protein
MQIVAAVGGCAPGFDLKPVLNKQGEPAGYDSNGDRAVDFRTVLDDRGVITALIYGNGEQAERIELDAIPLEEKRHLVLIVDGVGHDLLREFYEQGHFRLAAAPSLVVSPYPSLTDLSLNDMLACGQSKGFEAEYFDTQANKLAGGSWAYLQGNNMPYNARLDYRADLLTDALGYVFPWFEFKQEATAVRRGFRNSDDREYLAYFVTMAGLGTRDGAEGQLRGLEVLDRLVLDELYRTRGRLAVTIISDHGHTYTKARRIPLEEHLRDRGWDISKRLDGPEDVVYVRFGLETYASFATQRPGALASDLMAAQGVQLASFNDADHVVVLARGGQRAHVRQRDGHYSYHAIEGDPLDLLPVLEDLPPAPDGFFDADTLLHATAKHTWPAPLQRLWRAHRGGLAANTPDVIISLENDWYSGSTGFAGAVSVESTHGGLSYPNSAAFIMSSLGRLPAILRTRDIPAKLAEHLNATRWPLDRKAEDPRP